MLHPTSVSEVVQSSNRAEYILRVVVKRNQGKSFDLVSSISLGYFSLAPRHFFQRVNYYFTALFHENIIRIKEMG